MANQVDQLLGSDPSIAVPGFWTVAKDHISQLELGSILSSVLCSTGNELGSYQMFIIKEKELFEHTTQHPLYQFVHAAQPTFLCIHFGNPPSHRYNLRNSPTWEIIHFTTNRTTCYHNTPICQSEKYLPGSAKPSNRFCLTPNPPVIGDSSWLLPIMLHGILTGSQEFLKQLGSNQNPPEDPSANLIQIKRMIGHLLGSIPEDPEFVPQPEAAETSSNRSQRDALYGHQPNRRQSMSKHAKALVTNWIHPALGARASKSNALSLFRSSYNPWTIDGKSDLYGPAHDSAILEDLLRDELSNNCLDMLLIALLGSDTLVVPSNCLMLDDHNDMEHTKRFIKGNLGDRKLIFLPVFETLPGQGCGHWAGLLIHKSPWPNPSATGGGFDLIYINNKDDAENTHGKDLRHHGRLRAYIHNQTDLLRLTWLQRMWVAHH